MDTECRRSHTPSLTSALTTAPHGNQREGHHHGNHRLQERLHPWSLGKGSCHLAGQEGPGGQRGSPLPNLYSNVDPDQR